MTLPPALESPFTVFDAAYAQRALVAVLILAVAAAAVGGTIVLRDLPFFTHAVGTGAYPFVVIGVIAGVSLALSALVGALVFALVVALLSGAGRRQIAPGTRDALIGLSVAGALACGAIIAASAGSDNARLAVSPEALLFGSILTADTATLIVAAAAAAVCALAAVLLGDRWLAGGFDPGVSNQLGAAWPDLVLLACVALAAGATLPVTGALLAGALLIAPAATARIVTGSARSLAPATFALAAVEGATGVYLSFELNSPTGATIAAVSGVSFLAVAAGAATLRRRRSLRPAAALALLALGAVVLAGCGGSKTTAGEEGPLDIVTTTPQIADIVRNVAGDEARVTSLLPPGADPHEFEPKPKTVSALAGAQLVFRSGGDIDSWLLPAVKSAGATTPVDLSRAVVVLPAAAGEPTTSDVFNPHWYLDPQNVVRAAQDVRDELIKQDPDGRETYRANTSQYISDIDAAQSKLLACTRTIPQGDRNLLAGHNDFQYLADAFGFRVAAQLAASGEAEPSASDLQKSVDQARAANVRALVASKGEVTQLAKSVAGRLNIPLLQLYADSLATDDGASTLLGAIGYDVDRIASAVTDGKTRCPATG